MTPFGQKVRQLRAQKGVTQKEMAAAIGVSAAYLSALERGHRGKPGWVLLQKIIGYFNIIWEDADKLQWLAENSGPKVTLDLSNQSPIAVLVANRLANEMQDLSDADCRAVLEILDRARPATGDSNHSLPSA